MRIISSFRDYYDSVMRSGMDREVVYVRETKEVVLKDPLGIDFSTLHTSSYSKGSYRVETLFLGYCGAIYKVMAVSSSNPEWRYVFHNYEEFKSFMLQNKLGSNYDFRESGWWPSSYQKFKAFDTSKMLDLFHQFQTPLFLVRHVYSYRKPDETTITLGPCLKDFSFQQIKDPYTAYQDIFQYVAGVLNRPETRMVKISDKDKIHKHGFDKWSFRQKGPKK